MSYTTSSVPARDRKLYGIAENCHPFNIIYKLGTRLVRELWSHELKVVVLDYAKEIALGEIELMKELSPGIIFEEGISRGLTDEMALEILEKGDPLKRAVAIATDPAVIYRCTMRDPCEIVYLDEEFADYKRGSQQQGREEYWVKRIDSNCQPGSGTLIIAGSGHLKRGMCPEDPNVGRLPDMLSGKGIKLEIVHTTIGWDDIRARCLEKTLDGGESLPPLF